MLANRTVLLAKALAGVVLISTSVVLAREKKISKKELPVSVRTAFDKAYPHAKIVGMTKETEKAETLFEIESVDGTTRRDLLYKANGAIVEIEETMALNDLPEQVKATVQKESSGKRISKIEKVIHSQSVEYEIHMAIGKKKHELLVDSEGKVVRPEMEKQQGKNPEYK
jgi:hypothetical protein